jgi:hypothetical protein
MAPTIVHHSLMEDPLCNASASNHLLAPNPATQLTTHKDAKSHLGCNVFGPHCMVFVSALLGITHSLGKEWTIRWESNLHATIQNTY